MSKKAFTLIELLAVIVILAIIALIAVPIIINIIRDTKEKSREISKDLYLNAVEQTILKENIEGSLNPSSCKINIDGNIVCDGKEIKIEVNGERPCTGDIKLNKGMVVDSRLGYCKNNKEYKDNSGANTPELSGLTPVLYEDNSWVIADISEEWYDYEKYNWANAVILTDSGKKKQEGEKLNLEKDVKAMFVWIPRYEYKIDGQYGKNGISQTQPGEIEINFINGKLTTPSSNEYYVHPAFTFGEDELSGIWVGKFETSTDKISTCYTSENYTYCNNANQDPYILPNVKSLRYQNVSNQFATAKKFDKNIIGADSHMMKNREWGAVAYLSQSKYGKYRNPAYQGANEEVYQNKSSSFITGNSNGTPSQDDAITTQYTYDVELNGTGASTTGTVYGIYDMSGGSWERVMGNYNNEIGTSSGIDVSWFTNNTKYYDKYTLDYTDPHSDEEVKGHALKEISGWYGDYANFVNLGLPWFERGGNYGDGSYAGVFYFSNSKGNSYSVSFRVTIVPLN